MNQEFEQRKETKQSQVLTRSWLWSGSELVVVWIGSGSVWIRVWIGPEVDPHVCVCCSLDGVWQEKDRKVCRQQAYSLAAGWPYNLQQCQLGSLTAWMHNRCSLAAGLLSSVALQLGSLTAWLHNSLLLGCLAGWWITAEQETQKHATITGPDINSPINYIIPKVWIKGLDQILSKGLDRRSGSCVGPGLDPDPYILSRSHILYILYISLTATKSKPQICPKKQCPNTSCQLKIREEATPEIPSQPHQTSYSPGHRSGDVLAWRGWRIVNHLCPGNIRSNQKKMWMHRKDIHPPRFSSKSPWKMVVGCRWSGFLCGSFGNFSGAFAGKLRGG